MNQQVNQKITWEDVLQSYLTIKVLRPQSINNYTRYIKIFSGFFGIHFTDINAITAKKITMFRSFF